MKLVKRIVFGILIAAVLGTLGVVVWANDIAQPTDVALKALESDVQVTVTQQNGFITFEPAAMRTTTGFLFYPGGRVDYRAYAPVLHEIAAQGYFVALIQVRLNLAFFDVNAADKVIGKYPDIERWAIGGHSLGGVAAASYAKDHLDTIRAIAFWASYPADDSLKKSNILVLSLYGSNDGLATGDKIEASKILLPAHTQYVVIEGGNHGQFGSYGPQSGDNPASISPEEQWTQAANATVRLLASLLK
ncbi:MAG TPA: alpha/beta hydrolase [Anaerolineales bacterium]|nr:alpha/beta hydrolase [Anaerolineales bacterium]